MKQTENKTVFLTETEAMEYIFGMPNKVATAKSGIDYDKFRQYKHLYSKGLLKAKTKEILINAFDFEVMYKLKK